MTPTILVAGLGRCGTSLVMQMLAAGGVETVGTYPDFEHTGEPELRADADAWHALTDGKAVKVLNPHLDAIPPGGNYRTILLTRDVKQQAKSMAKLAAFALGAPAMPSRADRRALETKLRAESSMMGRAIFLLGRGTHFILPFEDIIDDPSGAARDIATFVAIGRPDPLNVDAMAACVRPRSPDCLPTLLELDLLEDDQPQHLLQGTS
ncbi:MAG: hypothetical protein VYD90_10525 [Pseudomonadota bacterium]|nr:hypothetical protein [Pseudomonadota bacterium]